MRFPSWCAAAPPPMIIVGPALGMICAPFAIVLNPTTLSATTCPPDNNTVAPVPPKKFPPFSHLKFN